MKPLGFQKALIVRGLDKVSIVRELCKTLGASYTYMHILVFLPTDRECFRKPLIERVPNLAPRGFTNALKRGSLQKPYRKKPLQS